MKNWTTFLISVCLLVTTAVNAHHWDKKQQEIIAFNEHLPLAINQDEFNHYERHFHPNYQHIKVEGNQHFIVKREAYLRGKKMWAEYGNYVTYNEVKPIEVIIETNFANSKFIRETHFVDHYGRKARQLEYINAFYERYRGKWTIVRLTSSNDITQALDNSISKLMSAE